MAVSEDRLERLRRAAEQEPDDDLAQYGFGSACLKAGQFEDAVRALTHAIQLNPEYSAAYRDLGRAHMESGRGHKAIETFRRGIGVAQKRGDLQTVREMEVFLRRAARQLQKR